MNETAPIKEKALSDAGYDAKFKVESKETNKIKKKAEKGM